MKFGFRARPVPPQSLKRPPGQSGGVRPLVALLALALLAGCVAPPDPGTGTPGQGETTMDVHRAWLTSDMTFAAQPEEERKAVRVGSFYADWAQGTDYPTWEGAPVEAATRVLNLSVELLVDASGPVVQSPRFPDIMVYGGAGGAWMGFNSTDELTVLVPGQVFRWKADLVLPGGGLWLPKGERLGLKVVPVMLQNDQADVLVLVGQEDGSKVWWTTAPSVDVPTVKGEGAQGEVAGSAYAGAAAPSTTSHVTKVKLEGEPRAFLVWMNTTGAQGVPDIDLAVRGPDGKVVTSAGTPTPREFIRLGPDNLRGPGEYEVVVTSYGSARATFTLDWATG